MGKLCKRLEIRKPAVVGAGTKGWPAPSHSHQESNTSGGCLGPGGKGSRYAPVTWGHSDNPWPMARNPRDERVAVTSMSRRKRNSASLGAI